MTDQDDIIQFFAGDQVEYVLDMSAEPDGGGKKMRSIAGAGERDRVGIMPGVPQQWQNSPPTPGTKPGAGDKDILAHNNPPFLVRIRDPEGDYTPIMGDWQEAGPMPPGWHNPS
jgi:hypothetical protein